MPNSVVELSSLGARTYGVGYGAAGFQVDWKTPVTVHLALEARREALDYRVDGMPSAKAWQTRGWVNAGLGYALPLKGVQPFVRVEGGVPLHHSALENSPVNLAKAFAPRYQAGLYAGLSF